MAILIGLKLWSRYEPK